MTKPKLRKLKVRGLTTAWLDYGGKAKTILLFLHGYPDTAETWKGQAEVFQEHYRVICPYSRGVGPSEAGEERRRYGQEATVLDSLAILAATDPSGQNPVFVIGHDLGAVQAWNLSAHLGKRLRGLVIVNGLSVSQLLSRWKRPEQWVKSWYLPLMVTPLLPEVLLQWFPKPLEKLMRSLGGVTREAETDFSPAMEQYRAYFSEIPKRLREKPKKLAAPVLVLWGHADFALATPRLDELEPYAHSITVRILEGNHWFFRENPGLINPILTAFFQRNENALTQKNAQSPSAATPALSAIASS